ncbi:MAG: septum site-determining protein MinC [Candidatus Eremiobacteraeota bacterium]|nr:septum site-determining protein MinC [Candidatus Eremiobacteraeota bacterium]MCW5872636.1 septum site-determining protein MinC [Candidatus Eremiobacteraeota bacterium]
MTHTLPLLDGVTLKGTRHGLLVCVREDLDFELALQQIQEKLALPLLTQGSDGGESGAFDNQRISLDLGWRELSCESFARLKDSLGEVELAGVLSTSLQTRTVAESFGIKAIIGRLGLAHHQGRRLRQEQREQEQAEKEAPAAPADSVAVAVPEPAPPPGADQEQEATLYIKRTLRSGQKAVYPGNIVLWGDLNPGSELEAEGDVLVLGSVRGRIHAGCNGNSEAQIYCQSLHPTVLRIADEIWTGDLKEAGLKQLPAAVKVTCAKDKLNFEPQTRGGS